ncbi:MAG TPA: hypothetical protein DCF87_09185 [Opitutae bacterium]|nr:hypothetical protein [Opitutae bacterium]
MTIVPHSTSHQKNKTRAQKVLTETSPRRGKASKLSNRILIIDSGDQGKWRKLEVFKGMQIYFAESVHGIIRSGFYQNFMFFAVAEKNAYVSKKNIKNLFKNRGISSSYVFDYAEASNLGKDSPENQLSKLEVELESQLDKSLATPEETLSKAINFIRSK